MKWYWILLIVLGAIAVGMIISMLVKNVAKSPVKTLIETSPSKDSNITVTKGDGIEVIKKDNADGTNTVAVARTK